MICLPSTMDGWLRVVPQPILHSPPLNSTVCPSPCLYPHLSIKDVRTHHHRHIAFLVILSHSIIHLLSNIISSHKKGKKMPPFCTTVCKWPTEELVPFGAAQCHSCDGVVAASWNGGRNGPRLLVVEIFSG
ncbi:Hypothetical predicted protein [Podarcis lilfordi]|uniref:Uncharacterized protein n=1 Tax=Podarcis lilfordi TaxID=74358 RepID=A0AA35JWI2_9SAUR|nr:Hypothetical predicted protein [Podarcis lilfordi]